MKPIPFARPDLTDKEANAVREVVLSGDLAQGDRVKLFEARFADLVGAKHAIATNSATQSALLLFSALCRGCSTVVTPSYTFTGPAMQARNLKHSVQLVDSGPDAINCTAEQFRSVPIGPHDVIMPMHFAGRAVDLAPIIEYARERKAYVIDDAAHALPAVDSRLKFVGAQGATATFFSFHVTKTLCTGHGGMIVTGDETLARELRARRLHGIGRDLTARYTDPGMSWEYEVERPGWKANMTDIAATMGLIQLDRLYEMRSKRAAIAEMYTHAFAGIDNLECPESSNTGGHAWHLFPVLTRHRDFLHAGMQTRGIGTSMHFIPLHRHRAWYSSAEGDFSNADRFYEQELSLPIYSSMTSDQVSRVIQAVREIMQEAKRVAGPSKSDDPRSASDGDGSGRVDRLRTLPPDSGPRTRAADLPR